MKIIIFRKPKIWDILRISVTTRTASVDRDKITEMRGNVDIQPFSLLGEINMYLINFYCLDIYLSTDKRCGKVYLSADQKVQVGQVGHRNSAPLCGKGLITLYY